MGIGGCTPLSTFVQALGDYKLAWGATPTGARSLMHFLNNSGKDLDLNLMLPLGIVDPQRKKYYDQMNSLFDLAEQTVIPGQKYSFITTNNTNDIWSVSFHEEVTNQDDAAMDWWLAVGGGRNGVKTTISCTTDTMNKKYYTAEIEYFLYDFYDWDENLEEDLANLHKYGLARSFRQYGSVSFTMQWIQGSRYPVYGQGEQYENHDIVLFKGIDDDNILSKYRDFALRYYYGGL